MSSKPTVSKSGSDSDYIKVFVRIKSSHQHSNGLQKVSPDCEAFGNSPPMCVSVFDDASLKLYTVNSCNCDICIAKRSINGKMSGNNPTPTRKKFTPKSDKFFNFNKVFTNDSTQDDIFIGVSDNISAAFRGYNSTIFTYGPTGTGKTYTMYGDKENPGIIPRAVKTLFELKDQMEDPGIKLELSFIELYNNSFRNLLKQYSTADFRRSSNQLESDNATAFTSPTKDNFTNIQSLNTLCQNCEKIDLHEHPDEGICFTGLNGGLVNIKMTVNSKESAMNAIAEGLKIKSSRSANDESTRLFINSLFIYL